MTLLQRFTEHIRKENLFQPSDRLLVAVSGGLDSVVLCQLCASAGFKFALAHANFGLRGKESDEDEVFVRQLAKRHSVSIHVKLFATEQYAAEKKISIQTAARELRYQWFDELLAGGYRWLLTAHHADDNIETALMHFFRGTGIAGLRAMQPRAGKTLRPLLPFFKDELAAYAKEYALVWREDSSNTSDKYSRNYFRHNILPLVKQVYPEAEKNLLNNLQRFSETEQLFQQAIAVHRNNLMESKGSEVHLPVLKLKKTVPLRTVFFEILKPFDFSAAQLNDALHLLDADTGKWIASATHRLIRNRKWLIIAPLAQEINTLTLINEGDRASADGLLEIESKIVEGIQRASGPATALIDAREVTFPLILRKWRPGDYFYPLGMHKKKKVSRFLIDLKLSPTEKQKILVLESGKKICWVVGLRIDERFKTKDNTNKIWQITARHH